jgi:two-component system sensor histidine kinase MtrB
VVAVSWAGGSRLVVVGRPPGGAEQMSYVNTDGSTVNASKIAGPSEVTGLAASEREDQPLLAQSGGGIARQHRDGTWPIVGPEGTAPAYPG